MTRTSLPASAALCLLLVSGCGGAGTTASPTTSVGTSVTSQVPSQASTAEPTAGSTAEPSAGTPESTAAPTSDSSDGATTSQRRCVSPVGYSFAVPEGWVTNTGDVAPACSYVDPEPFTVPQATDARPAAVSVYVDPVPFAEVAAERPLQTTREETTAAGVPAVRVETLEDGSRLYPDGARRTAWYLDLPPAEGEDAPRTLIAEVVASPASGLEHDELTEVLDRLVGSLRLEDATA